MVVAEDSAAVVETEVAVEDSAVAEVVAVVVAAVAVIEAAVVVVVAVVVVAVAVDAVALVLELRLLWSPILVSQEFSCPVVKMISFSRRTLPLESLCTMKSVSLSR